MENIKTTFPAPRTIEQAIRQANILTRARTFQADGYTYRACPEIDGDFLVETPDGETYRVCLIFDTCTCKSNERDGDCKHRIAVQEMEAERQMIEAEEFKLALRDEAENAVYGCDPHRF